MPRVRWGIESGDVDDFDRASQYKPYQGPIPPNAVYQWQIKILKSVAGGRDKYPQLRVGLELVPRKGRDENRYKGYFIMAFIPITQKTAFRYAPFLDAIGVSGRDFTERTITDEEGNVKKIGGWRNDGKALILGQMVDQADENGALRKQITWMGAVDGTEFDEDDEVEEEEEEYADVSDDEYGPDVRDTRRSSRSTHSRRRTDDEGDPF